MANEAEVLEGNEVEDKEPSIREALEDAFDQHEPESATPAAKPAEVAAPEASAEPVQTEVKAPATPVATEAAAVAPPSATSTQELKAPAQWKPHVREKWNTLPREVQEEITRREADGMRLLGSVGPKIKLAEEVGNHIAPYMDKLQESGVSTSAFIGDLFNSVKSLASGSVQERAEVVANIVQSYGVDLRTLDAILTQRISAPPEVAEARRQMARAQAVIQGRDDLVNHQSALEAEKALAAFGADPKHEFLNDVREHMAVLIETGQAKSLEEAYTAATWSNPDTRKILLTREAQSRAAVKTNRAALARKASSAVRGAPAFTGAPAGNGKDRTLREDIEDAWDQHSSL